MAKKFLTVKEALFPRGAIYEYYLQRLRIVLADRVHALKVSDIRDVPDSPDSELPAIEVVIRIAGLKLRNPVTGCPLISSDWLKQHFEGWHSQESFWLALAEYIRGSIPSTHPEARLREKFRQVKGGRPGILPARADLFVWYDELIRHLEAAKKWLTALPRKHQGFTKQEKQEFLEAASDPVFWWTYLVKNDKVTLEQIAEDTAQSTAKLILALKYGVDVETVSSRLFRRE